MIHICILDIKAYCYAYENVMNDAWLRIKEVGMFSEIVEVSFYSQVKFLVYKKRSRYAAEIFIKWNWNRIKQKVYPSQPVTDKIKSLSFNE